MPDQARPRMLTLVREAKGWTQRELGEQAGGMSQGLISKIEAGLLPLTGDGLDAVAEALQCPVALLTDDTPMQGLEVTCMHHRRRSSKLTAGQKRRIEALTHLTRVSVEGLLAGIELLPEAQVHRVDLEQYGNDPAEVARALRIEWRVPSGPIENVAKLLESVGIVMVTRALHTQAQDAVSTWPRDPGRPPLMVINTGLPPDRQRFTTCHELGHMVMHALPDDDQERQADVFAAEFLAPADQIGPQLAGLTTRDFNRLKVLKAQWGMSIAALVRRAYDLELITERQYREFNVQLGKRGWRRVEPVSLPTEQPSTLNRVMQVHMAEHDYTEEDLATVAGMLAPTFKSRYRPAPSRPVAPLRLVQK